MATGHPYYLLWTGQLNLGDTPGVFGDAQFAGLLLQVPITLAFVPTGPDPIKMLLMTSEVEVINGNKHPVYWDWKPGQPLPAPVGFIDDVDFVPGKPEFHPLEIPKNQATLDRHTVTIHVNADVPSGFRDDFVLRRIEAHETVGARVGW